MTRSSSIPRRVMQNFLIPKTCKCKQNMFVSQTWPVGSQFTNPHQSGLGSGLRLPQSSETLMSVTGGAQLPLPTDALGRGNHGKLLSRTLQVQSLGPPWEPVHSSLPPGAPTKCLFQGPTGSLLINLGSRCPSSLFLLAQDQDQTSDVTAGNRS